MPFCPGQRIYASVRIHQRPLLCRKSWPISRAIAFCTGPAFRREEQRQQKLRELSHTARDSAARRPISESRFLPSHEVHQPAYRSSRLWRSFLHFGIRLRKAQSGKKQQKGRDCKSHWRLHGFVALLLISYQLPAFSLKAESWKLIAKSLLYLPCCIGSLGRAVNVGSGGRYRRSCRLRHSP